MMLWEVQQQYKVYSSNLEGKTGFSQESKLVNIVNELKKRFDILSRMHPEIPLNPDDPGSVSNEKAIRHRMEVLKGAVSQAKVPEEVTQLSTDLMKAATEDLVKTGVSTREGPAPLPEDNSMMAGTKTAAKFVETTKDAAGLTTSFDQPTQLDANKKAFIAETSSLYGGCPACNKEEPTQEEKNIATKEVENKVVEEKASTEAQKIIEKQVVAEVPGPVEGTASLLQSMFKKGYVGATWLKVDPGQPSYATLAKAMGNTWNKSLFVGKGENADKTASEDASEDNASKGFDLFYDNKGRVTAEGRPVESYKAGDKYISYYYFQ